MPLDGLQTPSAVFYKERHIKYWLRCLKTHLPGAYYTSSDSNRIVLAFFIVSALDLLGALESNTTATERAEYVDWIYECQHPDGGFRGFTGTNLGSLRSNENAHWDPANLPATYFALAALAILGDDLGRLRRRQCLEWLPKLQRTDGSFGETLGEGASIEGGRDMRFCNCAAGVRWILRRTNLRPQGEIRDIDVGNLVRYIKASETYNGGMSEGPFQEAHAGFTYCAIGALSFLGVLTGSDASLEHFDSLAVASDARTTTLEEEEYYNFGDHSSSPDCNDEPGHVRSFSPAPATDRHPDILPTLEPSDLKWAGFNGRCNKTADTCYSWWVGGSLAMLNHVHLMDFDGNRRYLLEKTQHVVGGFSKLPGDPPDLLHSYFGLAALAIMGEPDLQGIDPTFCISIRAKAHLENS